MVGDPTTPDSALALDIKQTLTDRAGPEVSAVTLGNVPPGAVLSAGADNGDGTWSLALADLEGLAITPPPGWTGEINLVVSALSKSGDGATPTTTAFGISVMPAGAEAPPPPPEPPPAPEPGSEPSGEPLAFALEIDTGLGDGEPTEDVAVIISGVPAGAALSAGSESGDGIWTLTAADLPGLGLRPPADGDGDFILGIAVTRAGEVVTSGSLVVTVDGSLPATPDIPPDTEPAPETVPGAPGPAPAAYWKLDETAPGRATDEIGGHHGLTHGVEDEDAPGPFDAVAVFDGVDDCIEIPDAEALAPAGGTLTVWFNAFATGGGTLAAKGAEGFALRLDNGRLAFRMPSPDGPREIDAGPFGANEWNQATVTWGPAGMKTYLNGQLIASDDFAGGLTGDPAPWFFGAAETAAPEGETRALGDFFHGELDDIAIYAGQLGA
ncbi:MAG: LamG domain-containing protein, partial [Proteobacteria bacterium]|nr:LamG domain-containing protein [Pseudomonadota bacterium]